MLVEKSHVNDFSTQKKKKMEYFRIHTSDVAYMTQQPRGLFTAVGKLVDAKILNNNAGNEMYKKMTFYKEMAEKYGLKLYKTICKEISGTIIYEDEYQIATVNNTDNNNFITEEI